MNRTSFLAALAATVLCSALAACGGGGGDSSTQSTGGQQASNGSGDTSGTNGNSGSGGKANDGGDNSGAPSDGSLGTIPNCTPQNIVIVSMMGDDNLTDIFNSAELQTVMDKHFGSGHVQVLRYTTGPAGVDSSLYVSGDVRVVNYGMWDMINGTSLDHYMEGLANAHPTLIVTQDPIISPYLDSTAYVQAAKDEAVVLDVPVADVNGYILGQDRWQSWMQADGIRLMPDAIISVIDNVLAPAVQKQVAPLRCLLN